MADERTDGGRLPEEVDRADDAAPEADQEPEVEEADVADEEGSVVPEGGGDGDVVPEGGGGNGGGGGVPTVAPFPALPAGEAFTPGVASIHGSGGTPGGAPGGASAVGAVSGVGGEVAAGGGLAIWAAAAAIGDPGAQKLSELASKRVELKRERDRLYAEIRKEEKRRARDIERARGLSDDVLMNILALRACAKAKAAAAKAKAQVQPKGKAKSKAKAKAKAGAVDES